MLPIHHSRDRHMLNELEERILALHSRYPALFGNTGLASVRSAVLFLLFSLFFLFLLTVPEMLWDEHQNAQFYSLKLHEYDQQYRSDLATGQINEADCCRTWFSPRMWDYRRLVYAAQVREEYDTIAQLEQRLASWQSKHLAQDPPVWFMHYLFNPGFFWDIGILLPVSLAALAMAMYYLFGQLGSLQEVTSEGRQPYIPREAALTFLRCSLNPWTIGISIVVGLLMTAGNQGTGLLDSSVSAAASLRKDVFEVLLYIGYVVVLPYLYLALKGAQEIKARCLSYHDAPVPAMDRAELITSRFQWVKWLFFLSAVSSLSALVLILTIPQGWTEFITGAELSPYKPIQRVTKVILQSIGILSTLWVATLVVSCAKNSKAVDAMANQPGLNLTDRVSAFNDLALNEIRFLEYFGIFATLTLLSYAQSAIFIWQDANMQTALGLSILAGLVAIALILMIIPIVYIWYLYIDVKRFDRWAAAAKSSGNLTEGDIQELNRIQAARLKHVFRMVISRFRILSPLLTLFAALFFVTGLSGWAAGFINAIAKMIGF